MGVVFYTGRKPCLAKRLTEEAAKALNADGGRAVIVLVPEQMTLETEMLIMDELKIPGSFQLRVVSPERLCGQIFEEAGRPDRARVDERGRVMLLGDALRGLKSELKWYSAARARRGFEKRAVTQIKAFKQALMTPEDLESCADACPDSALKWKLNDLARIYEAYEAALEGRFQDGEDELMEAARRLSDAPTLAGAVLFAFGFDMTTPALNRFIARLAGVCASVGVFLPLENDGDARDFSIFLPLQRAYERMLACVKEAGVDWSREALYQSARERSAHAHFAREAYCTPAANFSGKNTSLQLAELKNPRAEAMFAAALARRLVMKNGWRYADILIIVENQAAYADALAGAFEMYGVPLFMSESRPAARHPLPKCLIHTLKLLSGADADIAPILLTGYMDVSDEDADKLLSYMLEYGLRAREILRPFRRGDPMRIEQMEPARARLAESINLLGDALTNAERLDDQLTALFDYMTRLNALEKGEAARARLNDMGYRALAAEDAQVWNRVIGTLDQMHELLGGEKVSRKQLCEMLENALDASEIKPLPQSGDAVHATRASLVGATPVKAILVLGATERGARAENSLFGQAEAHALSERAGKYLGMDALSEARADRMYMKNALSMAMDYLCITYPLSGSDDAAERPGPLVMEVKRIFPALNARGGVTEDEAVTRMLYASPKAALSMAAARLSAARDGEAVDGCAQAALCALTQGAEDAQAGLKRVARALESRVYSEIIEKELAKRIYGKLDKLSVTRLEQYARCPFSHFVKYGLNPTIVTPYGLNARDEGAFYHEAVRAFLADAADELSAINEAEAVRRMNGVSDLLFETALKDTLEDSATARAHAKKMRRAAARAAKALVAQMRDSKFTPIELEMEFGDTGGTLKLECADGARLMGRVDRVDAFDDGDTRYLRVIDYKRGKKSLDMGEIYHGLQLQLTLYMAAAIRKYGGKCAGAYYFRIDDPVFATECRDEDAIERERETRARMSGILPDDMELIKNMTPEPERVFRMRVLKNGDMDARTPKATASQFDMLMHRAVYLASHFTEEIRGGKTDVDPVLSEYTDACAYCEYKAVCQTDKRLPGSGKRRIKKLKPEEVLRLLGENRLE